MRPACGEAGILLWPDGTGLGEGPLLPAASSEEELLPDADGAGLKPDGGEAGLGPRRDDVAAGVLLLGPEGGKAGEELVTDVLPVPAGVGTKSLGLPSGGEAEARSTPDWGEAGVGLVLDALLEPAGVEKEMLPLLKGTAATVLLLPDGFVFAARLLSVGRRLELTLLPKFGLGVLLPTDANGVAGPACAEAGEAAAAVPKGERGELGVPLPARGVGLKLAVLVAAGEDTAAVLTEELALILLTPGEGEGVRILLPCDAGLGEEGLPTDEAAMGNAVPTGDCAEREGVPLDDIGGKTSAEAEAETGEGELWAMA